MITDDRRTSDGVTDKDRRKDKADIHNNAIGGNTILANVAHELKIVQDIDKRHRDIGHQLGGAVDAGLSQNACVQPGSNQPQPACVGS